MSTSDASAEGGADTSASEDFDLPLTDDVGDSPAEDDEEASPIAAKAEAKPAPAEAAASDEDELEALRKKREERRAKLEAERSKVDASGRVKELEEKAAKLAAAEGLAKGGKKLEAIKALGYDLDELITEHIEQMEEGAEDGVAPTVQDKALLKRLETLEAQLKAKQDAEEKATKDAQEAQLKQRQQIGFQNAVAKAKELLQADPDKYEVINATGDYEGIYREFSDYCRDNSLSFTADEEDEAVAMFTAFAARADEKLAERYAAAGRTKKVQSRLSGKTVAANTTEAAAKTAKRGGHVAPPVTTDDELDDIVDPRERARRVSGRFRIAE